jgi:hypothetical protein
MDKEKFVTYLKYQIEHGNMLKEFYQKELHRKFKLNRYMNTQRSEQKLINRFKEKFGENASVIMGDWSDAGHTMKYQTSSKTKGWEKVFERNKFSFYLLDEYRTSSRDPKSSSPNVPRTIIWRPNPRPWRRRGKLFGEKNYRKWKEINGLLCCTNINQENEQSVTFWNRDQLNTANMLKIVTEVTAGRGRPAHLSRNDVQTG